jgi:hypothetical protein
MRPVSARNGGNPSKLAAVGNSLSIADSSNTNRHNGGIEIDSTTPQQ